MTTVDTLELTDAKRALLAQEDTGAGSHDDYDLWCESRRH